MYCWMGYLLGATRENPHEPHEPVPRLLERYDARLVDHEADALEHLPVRLLAERGEKHRRSEPVRFDFVPCAGCPQRRQEPAAGSQPPVDAPQQLLLLSARDVSEHEEGRDR